MNKTNRIIFFGLIGLTLSLFRVGAVRANEPTTNSVPQLSYSADLSLDYVDKIENPFARSNYIDTRLPNPRERQPQQFTRTLGLGRFSLALDFTIPNQSKMHLLLRPDVLNRPDEFTDYDTRTGRVYFPQTKAKFIDEYYLTLIYDQSLDISFGVFNSLTDRYMAYTPLLEFGLEVRLPERFSAARMNWSQSKAISDKQTETVSFGWFADAFVLQGNNDRSETQSTKDSTQDNAPASQDAHLGLAAMIGYEFSDKHRIGLLLGMGKNDYSQESDVDGIIVKQSGKREENYGQIFDSLFLKLPYLSTKFSLDYRIMKEKWKSDAFVIEPRTHQSLAFSVSTQLQRDVWVYTGALYGTSKMQNELVVTGYQLDGGVSFNPKQNIFLNAQVSEEHRENRINGTTEGAYIVNGGEASIMRRFALELRYLLNGR